MIDVKYKINRYDFITKFVYKFRGKDLRIMLINKDRI
jgi:hypothetical protein